MDGKIDIFTIMFLVLAVVIILKLRTVLGRRTSDDEARIDRKAALERARAADKGPSNDKVVALPRRERPDQPVEPTPNASAAAEERARVLAAGNPSLEEGLLAIVRADSTFDPDVFMKGARQAYEMIVTAFAEGNRKVLRSLLSKDVFDGFSAAISEREARGEIIDQSFVSINKAELMEVELKNGVAQITIKFISELISATRDRAGVVIAGDPKRITEVVDIWTFAREVASRDPNWRLISTQAPN